MKKGEKISQELMDAFKYPNVQTDAKIVANELDTTYQTVLNYANRRSKLSDIGIKAMNRLAFLGLQRFESIMPQMNKASKEFKKLKL